MAAFMFRLDNKGVFLPKDGKAADADRVDGIEGAELRTLMWADRDGHPGAASTVSTSS